MAQFIEKTDYFGLAGSTLACTQSDDGRSAEVAEVTGADGSIIANNVYGEKISPSNNYQLKGTYTLSAGQVKLGAITEAEDASICLNSFSINTEAGSAPTIDASGEQVEEDATADCYYEIPAITLPKQHHAFVLLSAFTFGGTGVHLKSASYSCNSGITTATKDGIVLTHDVVEGKIDANVEFVQTGSAKPTLSAGTDWVITSPLACSNPDADFPSWSATLTKYLAKAD